jgi:hypothetical protein
LHVSEREKLQIEGEEGQEERWGNQQGVRAGGCCTKEYCKASMVAVVKTDGWTRLKMKLR